MLNTNDLAFNYFLGEECEQFSFIKIPKVFFTEDRFKDLSYGAKILYGLLLERMSLSRKNKWVDEKNRVYIIYTIESIRESFHVSNSTAVKLMQELEEFGLIEKKRRPNAAAMIYVKNFISHNTNEVENDKIQENSGSSKNGIPEMEKLEFPKVEFQNTQQTSGSLKIGIPENGLPEVQKIESNKTNINKTDINYLLLSSSELDEDDVKRLIKELVNYNEITRDGTDRFFVDKIIGCLANVFLSDKKFESINGSSIPIGQLRLRIAQNLSEENFKEILDNMHINGTGTIYNLQKYVMACFYKIVKIDKKIVQQMPGCNSFNNFKQNTYDFVELEKELLANGKHAREIQ